MANVNLGERFEAFIQEQIRGGRYQNVSEVVRAGLRLLEDQELERQRHLEKLKADIQAALDDPRPAVPMDEVFNRLEAKITAEMRKHGEKL